MEEDFLKISKEEKKPVEVAVSFLFSLLDIFLKMFGL